MGVFSFLGGLATNYANSRNVDKTNEANKQIMQEQNAFNLDMWNRQNEYNTPINQMRRLQEAGINPALAFSNGSVSGNISSSPASASQSLGAVSKTFSNPVLDYYDGLVKEQQLKNMETERQLTGVKTEETRKNIALIEGNTLNVNKDTELKAHQIEEINANIAGVKANVEKLKAEASKLDAQAVHHYIEAYVADLTKEAKVRQEMQKCNINDKQLELLICQALDIKAGTRLKGVDYELLSLEYKNNELVYNMNKNKADSWYSQKWYQNVSAVMSLIGMALGSGSQLMDIITKPRGK